MFVWMIFFHVSLSPDDGWLISSQTRIVWKVDDQFLHACWWLWRLILDAHPLPHFGQTKVWDADGRDAARFLPPAFFLCGFMPLCLELTTGIYH